MQCTEASGGDVAGDGGMVLNSYCTLLLFCHELLHKAPTTVRTQAAEKKRKKTCIRKNRILNDVMKIERIVMQTYTVL